MSFREYVEMSISHHFVCFFLLFFFQNVTFPFSQAVIQRMCWYSSYRVDNHKSTLTQWRNQSRLVFLLQKLVLKNSLIFEFSQMTRCHVTRKTRTRTEHCIFKLSHFSPIYLEALNGQAMRNLRKRTTDYLQMSAQRSGISHKFPTYLQRNKNLAEVVHKSVNRK